MSEFKVQVLRINEVLEHPNADRLNLNKIGDYITISNKHEDGSARYKAGDLVVYIPEAAIVPDWLLQKMGFWNEAENKGSLSGKDGNRVKAMKLRGIVSQGIMYPLDHRVHGFSDSDGCSFMLDSTGTLKVVYEGDDVADSLGITKYEPRVPAHMAGEVANIHGRTVKYDIENFKRYPDILQDGEEVVMTEKLHGTFLGFGWWPGLDHPDLPGDVFAFSKGLGAQGLVFKDNEANQFNIYLQTAKGFELGGRLKSALKRFDHDTFESFWTAPIFLFGEIFGAGVQDLQYGLKAKTYRVFDVWMGDPTGGRFLNVDEKVALVRAINTSVSAESMVLTPRPIEMVPILYRGPFSKDVMLEHTKGKTTFGGAHIREGVVITPVVERRHEEIGRVILKSVSDDYLLRKGEVTEYT